MRIQKMLFFTVFLLAVILLSGCKDYIFDHQKTIEATQTEVSVWYRWTSLPENDFADATQEEIAARLFTLYLDQFQSESIDKNIQLVDYQIISFSETSDSDNCANEIGVNSIFEVKYSVEPFVFHNSDWIAGSGNISESGKWINDKLAMVALYKEDGSYMMKLLADPPCGGVAIDGNTVP